MKVCISKLTMYQVDIGNGYLSSSIELNDYENMNPAYYLSWYSAFSRTKNCGFIAWF